MKKVQVLGTWYSQSVRMYEKMNECGRSKRDCDMMRCFFVVVVCQLFHKEVFISKEELRNQSSECYLSIFTPETFLVLAGFLVFAILVVLYKNFILNYKPP